MEENKEKKMSLQEWSMHYRQIIILLVSCLVALGVFGLAKINKNEFPDFTIRQGVVVAVYPGVTAQEMEEQVKPRRWKSRWSSRWRNISSPIAR